MPNFAGRAFASFGFGAIGAAIGGMVGAVIGFVIALATAGVGALDWYHAQPPDWWIVSIPCAVVFVVIIAAIEAAVGALILGAIGGACSLALSAVAIGTSRK